MATSGVLKRVPSPLASVCICDEKIICRASYDETGIDSSTSNIPDILRGDEYVQCRPVQTPDCTPFQLTQQKLADAFQRQLISEQLNIAGADINVYKMLGVHEQCKLVDSTGNGIPISNGDLPKYPNKNAFDIYQTEWRSIQKGEGVVESSYIGYDFGPIKTLDNTRNMYAVETGIRKHITAFAIKQSPNHNNRVSKIRLERSDDGKKWYGVALLDLPDDDCLNTILCKNSVPMRYWRLRPIQFYGSTSDHWAVQALQLFHEYQYTNLYNIQDKIFLENRDRNYSTDAIRLKGYYDLIDNNEELSKFGIELPNQTYNIKISFDACFQQIGRPLVIGDMIELPSELWYSSKMRPIKKWLEITDVSWDISSYSPMWRPTMLKISAQPAFVSQENQDIFGDLEAKVDNSGLFDKNDGNSMIFQDYFDSTQTAISESKNNTPERGAEVSSTIRQFTVEEIESAKQQHLPNLTKIGQNARGHTYVEDAMPPNNEPYTEGDEFPTNPKHGDFHRLTYSTLSQWYPPRLHRYSSVKNRWVYMETDRRQELNPTKPILVEYTNNGVHVPDYSITKPSKPLLDCEEDK